MRLHAVCVAVLALGCSSPDTAATSTSDAGESSESTTGLDASSGAGSSSAGSSSTADSSGEAGSTGDAPVDGCAHDDVLASRLHGFRGALEDCAQVGALYDEHFTIGDPVRVIHVAPPEGALDGVGTKADPRRDLKGALEAAEAGDHFHLAPGVYPMDEIRDTFGHEGSLVFLASHGTRADKIVVQTDPELYDPDNGVVATIDFQFGNGWPNHRTFAMFLTGSHWVLQGLEIENMASRGIWVSGTHGLVRDCEIHHVDHDGTDNHGLVVAATSGPSYNLVMGNHFHHSGILDDAGNVADLGGLNGGCIYSETRQGYDSDMSGIDETSSWEEFAAAKNAPDSEFYYYGNVVHDCHNGIATKNNSEGPFYVLSNVVSNAHNGIKITLAHSVVRNNIVYRDDFLGTGILVGWSASSGMISQVLNGVGFTIANNTIVGADSGTDHFGGWDLRLHDNVFVDVGTAHRLARNVYEWYTNDWPGVVGEWAYADLDADHPYYEYMPQALQDRAGVFRRVEALGNVYPAEPTLVPEVESDFYDLGGTVFSDDHTIVDSATLREHMRDPDAGDHRRDDDDPGPLAGVGSGMR
jgi:hypothetical protein